MSDTTQSERDFKDHHSMRADLWTLLGWIDDRLADENYGRQIIAEKAQDFIGAVLRHETKPELW